MQSIYAVILWSVADYVVGDRPGRHGTSGSRNEADEKHAIGEVACNGKNPNPMDRRTNEGSGRLMALITAMPVQNHTLKRASTAKIMTPITMFRVVVRTGAESSL